MDLLTQGVPLITTLWSIFTVLVIGLVGYLVAKTIQTIAARVDKVRWWVDKVKEGLSQFKDGILAARKVKRWWMFIIYTILIWTCYTLMSYIPFFMFEATSGLGILEALTITVISAIGIAIPSPGGLGTYHYFVKQSLSVLFGVGLAAGLTYATITHATTALMVILFTPIALAIDKWRQTKKGTSPI
jgi:hypothetical protein